MDMNALRRRIVEVEKKIRHGNGNLAELNLELKGLNSQLAEAERAAFDAWSADAKKAR
jgi:predicted  nucleic acid-binding Zn-ribbon protein